MSIVMHLQRICDTMRVSDILTAALEWFAGPLASSQALHGVGRTGLRSVVGVALHTTLRPVLIATVRWDELNTGR